MKKSDAEKKFEYSLKEIIRTELRLKGKTQADLMNYFCDKENDIDQSRVSKCLSAKTGDFFNLSQLALTAEFLGCSLDEWIRQQAPNQPAEPDQKHSSIETVADILQILFDLSDALGDSFKVEVKETRTYDYGNGKEYSDYSPVISFDVMKFDRVLTEWMELQNSKMEEKVKADVIRTWKKGTLDIFKHQTIVKETFPFE